MIYSIGYQKLSLAQLLNIINNKNILNVLDIRSKPYSVRKEFNRRNLEDLLKGKYVYKGDILGGFGHIKEEGIRELADTWNKKGNVLLMCMEHDPEQCHRFKIARKLLKMGIHVIHIMGDLEIPADALLNSKRISETQLSLFNTKIIS